MADCSTCRGRRHVQSDRGWKPCPACFAQTLSQFYIKPGIRMGETEPDPAWQAVEPWPLETRTEGGAYREFRHRVWRSLLHYYAVGQVLNYDYVDAFRLADIHFERDEQYRSVRQLDKLDLVVIAASPSDPPNSYVPPLIEHVRHLRNMAERPTWIFQPQSRRRLEVPEEAEPAAMRPRAGRQIL